MYYLCSCTWTVSHWSNYQIELDSWQNCHKLVQYLPFDSGQFEKQKRERTTQSNTLNCLLRFLMTLISSLDSNQREQIKVTKLTIAFYDPNAYNDLSIPIRHSHDLSNTKLTTTMPVNMYGDALCVRNWLLECWIVRSIALKLIQLWPRFISSQIKFNWMNFCFVFF